MTRMTKNNVDIWHKMRFIAIPVLAIAAHFLLSNLLYYFVERLFLDIFHIPVQQFMKYSYLGELLISTVLILVCFIFYKLLWRKEENERHTEANFKDATVSLIAGLGVSGISCLWVMLAEQIPALQRKIGRAHV